MSRKIKNIVMIILIIALLFCTYVTMNYVQNNTRGETPPEMSSDALQQRQSGNNNESQPTNSNSMSEPPAKPDGQEFNMQTIENGNMIEQNRDFGNMQQMNDMRFRNNGFAITYYILFGVESLGISLLLIYLIISKFNSKTLKETFVSSDKIIIYILLVIILTAIITFTDIQITNRYFLVNNFPQEETAEKQTTAEDVDKGTGVTDKNINLNDYTSNVTITDTGEYTLTGEFNNTILVNANGDVTLNLDGITVKNDITSAIANISNNSLTINLKDGTENTVSDGGSSEYDGCIYSAGPLTITGNGKLNVYGNQEEGEGIATETNDITINGGNIYIECKDDGINAGGDGGTITINDGTVYIKASGDGIDSNKNIVINGGTVYAMGSSLGGDAGMDADQGFEINGGLVIAIGSDMLERPATTSKQNSLCTNLDTAIESGTLVTLTNNKDEVIVSFEARETFKTLIISDKALESGTYNLYKNGTNTGTEVNGIYQNGSYTKGDKISSISM